MHEAGGPRRSDARDRLGLCSFGDLGGYGTREDAILPVFVQGPVVAAGHELGWAVLKGHLVEEVEDGEHVVIGVGLEQDVLVELHLGGGSGLFRVDLRVVELDVRSDELCRNVDGEA